MQTRTAAVLEVDVVDAAVVDVKDMLSGTVEALVSVTVEADVVLCAKEVVVTGMEPTHTKRTASAATLRPDSDLT